MQSRVFAVLSWGCAGTAWLAKAFNSHPEVFCTHAAPGLWRSALNSPTQDALCFTLAVGAFSDHYLAIGDVHGIERHEVVPVRKKLGALFRCATVVREPIARLQSQLMLFENFGYSRWGGLGYVDAVAEAAGIEPSSLSLERRHFLHGVNMLNAILDEVPLGPIYRMEDLTTSASAFTKLFLDLTAGEVQASDQWASDALKLRRVNEHSEKRQISFSTEDLRIIERVVKPEAWSEYQKLGYRIPSL
jgi:hypothetical protein